MPISQRPNDILERSVMWKRFDGLKMYMDKQTKGWSLDVLHPFYEIEGNK